MLLWQIFILYVVYVVICYKDKEKAICSSILKKPPKHVPCDQAIFSIQTFYRHSSPHHLSYPLCTSWHRVPPLFLVSLVKVNFLSFWFL